VKLRRHFLLLPAFLLAGCGSISMPTLDSINPFSSGEIKEKDRKPANSTEYRCADGKAFYVRTLDAGAVWLIAPDREVRLAKLSDGRFGVGRVTLEIGATEATLTDPPSIFSNCKRAG
jgi:hypothetical protein